MDKKVKLPIIITSAVVGALLIVVLILSLISVNPLTSFIGGYSSMELYMSGETDREPDNDRAKEELEKGLAGTKFSVMHAILEGRFVYSPKFMTEKDEDGKKKRVERNVLHIRVTYPSESEYMLEFSYNTPRTVKVEGEDITFDRLKVIIYDTNGEIEKMELYPYMYDKITETPMDTYYLINVIEVWSNTSSLCNTIKNYGETVNAPPNL